MYKATIDSYIACNCYIVFIFKISYLFYFFLFQVPEKFLEVTRSSLREFFLAIRAGKDCDPAWKKVIYKVICKLDQDIPELFKSPNVLDHLDEISD